MEKFESTILLFSVNARKINCLTNVLHAPTLDIAKTFTKLHKIDMAIVEFEDKILKREALAMIEELKLINPELVKICISSN